MTGLALICPLGTEVMGSAGEVPEHVVLHASGDLGGILDPALEEGYRGYLVVQTPETLRRLQEREGPGVALADAAALERNYERHAFRVEPERGPAYPHPTLSVTGRQDATVGYAAAWGWLEHYPRATFAVLDRAGHGLPHEQVGLLNALMTEWLDRVREHRSADRGRERTVRPRPSIPGRPVRLNCGPRNPCPATDDHRKLWREPS